MIALRLVELKECRELLSVTESQVTACDSLNAYNRMIIEGLDTKLIYKDRIIDLELKENTKLKRRNAVTVGLATVGMLVSLFIAIR